MKLASLRTGGRDGRLVVVDDQLTRALPVPHVAPTLAAAIEDWAGAEPRLAAAAVDGAGGWTELELDALASPLPRSHQFLDGSVYLAHMERARAARGAEMPANHRTEPVMYQGMSDGFRGPREPMCLPDEADEIDYEPEIAVVVDDVPMGTPASEAARHVKLVMLLNDYTLRALTRTELPKGFGFLQAKPTSSFSPVAVTASALGNAWDGERFHLRVRSSVNGVLMGEADAGNGMYFGYHQLIAHAARTRSLSAGTIIGAGSISDEAEGSGHGCLAEARISEQIAYGAPRTPWLRFGDVVRIEAFDAAGASVFGAIEQRIEKAVPGA